MTISMLRAIITAYQLMACDPMNALPETECSILTPATPMEADRD